MHASNDASPPNSGQRGKPCGAPGHEGEARGNGCGCTASVAALAVGVGLLLAPVTIDAQSLDATAPMDVAQSLERVRPARAVPGEIIVKFRESEGPTPRLLPETATPLGLSTAAVPTSGGELIYRLNIGVLLQAGSPNAVAERVARAVAQLNTRDDVEYAQPNWIVYPSATPTDPGYASQWHYWMNGTGPGQSPGGINLPNGMGHDPRQPVGRGRGDRHRHLAGASRHRGLAEPRRRLRHDQQRVHRERWGRTRRRPERPGRRRGRGRVWRGRTGRALELARQSRRRDDRRGAQQQCRRRSRGQLAHARPVGSCAGQVRRLDRRHQRCDPVGGGVARAGRADQPDPGAGHQHEPRRRCAVHLLARDPGGDQ